MGENSIVVERRDGFGKGVARKLRALGAQVAIGVAHRTGERRLGAVLQALQGPLLLFQLTKPFEIARQGWRIQPGKLVGQAPG